MSRHIEYERLSAVYRGLDSAARATVDAHLQECSSCAARLAGYERAEQVLRALPEPRLPARLQRPWPALLAARASAEPDRRRGSPRLVLGRALLPAGLIALLVVGGWLLLSLLTGSDHDVTATPTLTLTPTATVVAFLDDDGPISSALPGATLSHRPPAPAPAPPRLTAMRAGASALLHTP